MQYFAFCIWAAAWDFQDCGMCDQQRLRPACAYAQSDQSLCLSLQHSMTVKLLTAYHLEFQSLKGGCTGSSESTLVKMPHCWKSHAVAQFSYCTFEWYSNLLHQISHNAQSADLCWCKKAVIVWLCVIKKYLTKMCFIIFILDKCKLLYGCAYVWEIIYSLKLMDYLPVYTHKLNNNLHLLQNENYKKHFLLNIFYSHLEKMNKQHKTVVSIH